MTKKENKEDRGGCFAWFIRLKKAVNERWAKSLNALRRIYSNQVNVKDVLNETGTPDVVISKIPVRPKSSFVVSREYLPDGFDKGVSPISYPYTKTDTDIVEDVHGRSTVHVIDNTNGGPDKEQVRLYVVDVINNAKMMMRAKGDNSSIIQDDMSMTSSVISDLATAVVNASLTNIAEDIATKQVMMEDTTSLSSGEISVLAEAAVTQSLTSIMNEYQNENHSARSRPRTVTEMLEHLNIDTCIGLVKDGEDAFLPPCSP